MFEEEESEPSDDERNMADAREEYIFGVEIPRGLTNVGFLTVQQMMLQRCQRSFIPDCPLSSELISLCKLSSDNEVMFKLQFISDLYNKKADYGVAIDSWEIDKELQASIRNGTIEHAMGLTLEEVLNLPDSKLEMSTPLHIASNRGLNGAIWMMLLMGADPSIVDIQNRPPYFVGKDKDSRDVFRRFRAANEGERDYEWGMFGIPVSIGQAIERNNAGKAEESRTNGKKKKSKKGKKKNAGGIDNDINELNASIEEDTMREREDSE